MDNIIEKMAVIQEQGEGSFSDQFKPVDSEEVVKRKREGALADVIRSLDHSLVGIECKMCGRSIEEGELLSGFVSREHQRVWGVCPECIHALSGKLKELKGVEESEFKD